MNLSVPVPCGQTLSALREADFLHSPTPEQWWSAAAALASRYEARPPVRPPALARPPGLTRASCAAAALMTAVPRCVPESPHGTPNV